jgi:phosphatidylglycerophosphate synthase
MPIPECSHVRQHRSLLAGAEKRLLIAIARRLPSRVTSDQLSLLALVSMLVVGSGFAAMRATPWGALTVFGGLVGNWFGDSLDGTLARVRGHERPRFGYYVDHAIDLAGTVALFAGLACSGVMSPLMAMAVLSGYLLVCAEVFLATYSVGVFRMARAGMGPTELRILLIAGALYAAWHPFVDVPWFGAQRLFDVGGAIALVGFAGVFVTSTLRHTRHLYELEPLPAAPALRQPIATIVALVLALSCAAGVLRAAPSSESPPSRQSENSGEHALDRFLHGNRPILTSYRAYRRLEASTLGGSMQASLEAWTYVSNGRFGFEVIREEGSGLIRDHVLRKALETEQQNFNDGETNQVELTPANYTFHAGAASDETATIGIKPRRLSPMLLNGTVTVTRQEGDIVRIDGSPSQTPSWWTRHVDIVRRYTRIHGVGVPVEMSSRADVRVVGDSKFLMTYTYATINGRSVF